MLSTDRNESMELEQNSGGAPTPQIPMGPPEGPRRGLNAIFWNDREFRAGWRLLVYLLFTILFALAAVFLAAALHLPQVTRTALTPTSMLVQESAMLIAVLAAASIMSLLEGRSFGAYGLPRGGAFGAHFWQGAVWGIAMIAAIMFLIRAFGGFSFGELALRGPALWRYALLWGAVFLSVGFFEEFLFRGYAQFTLATGMGFWPAATALSAAFGALHLANPGEGRIGALGVFAIGMFFCLMLRRTGNLWFSVGAHAAMDWCETFLFSVPDSGIVAPGHLLNSSLHGPAWLTGGSVGPEGSVMAFVVVALAAILFAIVYPAKESPV
jgi:membrane protease YdiL (CAAX protease family)